MKVLGLGSVILAASLVGLAQPAPPAAPAPPQRAHSASGIQPVETPYLGVGGKEITSERAKALKLKEERGAEITSVTPDSAAAKAGIKEGDVVLDYNGQKVESWEQLKRLVHETPIHREVKIGVWRNGAEQTLTATIGSVGYSVELGDGTMMTPDWVQPMPAPAPMPAMPAMPYFDMPMLRTLTNTSTLGIVGEGLGQEAQLAEFFGVKDGVLVRSVNKDSAAEKAGMKAGDVITKVDDTAIATPQQITGALRAAHGKSSVTVTVVRNKKEMTLTVTPDQNGFYRGGIWDPKNNVLLQLFQPGRQ